MLTAASAGWLGHLRLDLFAAQMAGQTAVDAQHMLQILRQILLLAVPAVNTPNCDRTPQCNGSVGTGQTYMTKS